MAIIVHLGDRIESATPTGSDVWMLSAVFHKYGDVFFWRIEYRSPVDRSRPRENTLRDGPEGLLRVSGIWPERAFRQGEWIRKRIYEMPYLGRNDL